jgi:hypothetical protein
MPRKKVVKKNPVGDSERFYGEQPITGSKLLKKPGRKRTLASVSKYPAIDDLYAMIDSLNQQQIQKYSDTESLPVIVRDLLFEFAEDWSNMDRDHTNYLSQVPDGYDKFEAAVIGDLLYWMITGANEKSKLRIGNEVSDLSWNKEIEKMCPNFLKKLEKFRGLDIHDLPGLHIRILNNLPVNSYNRYTIAQITLDDPQIGEQVFPSPEPMEDSEIDAIQALKRLVADGNLKKFSIALSQSSKSTIQSTGTGVGAHIFQAFELAKNAVDAFDKGDVASARRLLDAIQNEYDMDLNTFQTGLKDMFVVTASALTFEKGTSSGSNNRNQNRGGSGGNQAKVTLKGGPEPLLVSLDTSMPPTRKGWPKSNMHELMKIANQANTTMNAGNNLQFSKNEDTRGTAGLTAVKLGNNNVLTTSWIPIFYTAITGEEPGRQQQIMSEFPDQKSVSLRFIIHANLAVGIGNDFLVPKGTLTVTMRRQPKKTWRDSVQDSDSFFFAPIDFFVEDLGRAKFHTDAFTEASLSETVEAATEVGDDDIRELSQTGRGKVKKNPRGAIGKAVAIDIVPRSQINVKTLTEKHPSLKYLKKVVREEGLESLYDNYGKGQVPSPKSKAGTYRWRNKTYKSKAELQAALDKKGNQVDKGHPKMQILYAKRKDNGNLVPHRIILPRILVRHDKSTNKIVANKGSKATAQVRKLLKRIEKDFGSVNFVKDLTVRGSYDPNVKSKQVLYNRGVAKQFQSEGHPPGMKDASNLFVSQVQLNGGLVYDARLPGGKRLGPVALRWGAKQ